MGKEREGKMAIGIGICLVVASRDDDVPASPRAGCIYPQTPSRLAAGKITGLPTRQDHGYPDSFIALPPMRCLIGAGSQVMARDRPVG
jgi:hypothetical protein